MAEQKPDTHQPSLDHSLLGSALAQVRDADAWWAAKSCLIFMALTCTRSNDARMATWDEIDLEDSTLTIPASRIKAETSHRVPLSTQAKELLGHAREQTDPGGSRIFPPQRGSEYMNASRLSILLKKLEIQTVPAGFRSSFQNWIGGQIYIPVHVSEMVLAHKPPPAARRAFRPRDFFQERQPIMQEWADYLTETMGPVTPTTEAEA